jgi:cytochrome c-type biogenesis protein CcmH/NrfG
MVQTGMEADACFAEHKQKSCQTCSLGLRMSTKQPSQSQASRTSRYEENTEVDDLSGQAEKVLQEGQSEGGEWQMVARIRSRAQNRAHVLVSRSSSSKLLPS